MTSRTPDNMAKRLEYRVIWKREGLKVKRKRYPNRVMAERFMLLFGTEPWRVYEPRKGPDDYYCCSGRECGCGGITVKEEADEKRKDMPKLEWMRLEQREVGEWKQ